MRWPHRKETSVKRNGNTRHGKDRERYAELSILSRYRRIQRRRCGGPDPAGGPGKDRL